MRILLSYLMVCGLSFTTVFSQNIDSLSQLTSKTTDDEKLVHLYALLGQAYFNKDLDSTGHYYEKAIALGKELVSDSLMREVYKGAGQHYIYVGVHDKALEYLYKGLELSEGNEVDQAKSLFNIGTVHYRQGERKKALDFLIDHID